MSNEKPVSDDFDDFLKEAGIYEEVTEGAVKRLVARELRSAMAELKLTKKDMAKLMNTSRSQLERVLDPDYEGVQLDTLVAAARAVGRELRIELVAPAS